MQNVLFHGVSGAVKGMIIEKVVRDHRFEFALDTSLREMVSMKMPPLPTMRSFFAELLRCLDCPVITESRISELENDALRRLTKPQPRLLAIDDVSHQCHFHLIVQLRLLNEGIGQQLTKLTLSAFVGR
jgi:hypothetical protein